MEHGREASVKVGRSPSQIGLRLASSSKFVGYLFVAPILIFMGIWFYYPLLRSFVYSFQDISFLNPDAATFIGLQNYTEMMKDSDFWGAFKNSVIITVIAVPLQSVIALLIAVGLNKITRLKTTFRTLFYLPYITSTVAVTTVQTLVFEKIANIHTSLDLEHGQQEALKLCEVSLDELRLEAMKGYGKLLQDSTKAWREKWAAMDIKITSLQEFDQLAIRFAQYHLVIMAPAHDNRFDIAAKGLTGEGYKGHSFWDTEINQNIKIYEKRIEQTIKCCFEEYFQ